jgi:hypothetical protein
VCGLAVCQSGKALPHTIGVPASWAFGHPMAAAFSISI